MEKIKNYAILILFITAGVLAFLIFCRQPDVIKTEIIKEKWKISSTVVTIKANTTVTGASGATVQANGNTVVSGTNLTIKTDVSSTSTTISTEKEKEKIIEKISYSEWMISGSGSININPIGFMPESVILSKRLFSGIYFGVGYNIHSQSAVISASLTF